jgi:hypothetical protein
MAEPRRASRLPFLDEARLVLGDGVQQAMAAGLSDGDPARAAGAEADAQPAAALASSSSSSSADAASGAPPPAGSAPLALAAANDAAAAATDVDAMVRSLCNLRYNALRGAFSFVCVFVLFRFSCLRL